MHFKYLAVRIERIKDYPTFFLCLHFAQNRNVEKDGTSITRDYLTSNYRCNSVYKLIGVKQ